VQLALANKRHPELALFLAISCSAFLTMYMTLEPYEVALHSSKVVYAVKNVEQGTAWE